MKLFGSTRYTRQMVSGQKTINETEYTTYISVYYNTYTHLERQKHSIGTWNLKCTHEKVEHNT